MFQLCAAPTARRCDKLKLERVVTAGRNLFGYWLDTGWAADRCVQSNGTRIYVSRHSQGEPHDTSIALAIEAQSSNIRRVMANRMTLRYGNSKLFGDQFHASPPLYTARTRRVICVQMIHAYRMPIGACNAMQSNGMV